MTEHVRPIPDKIHLRQSSGELTLHYGASSYTLTSEYLRVYSPSAEVRGHGRGNEILQRGKRGVRIISIEPAGNYALKFVFSDGHDSGLYDWETLYDLATRQDEKWAGYLARLEAAGGSRDP